MSDWSALAFFSTPSECNAPSNLNTTHITATYARANWDVVAEAVSYVVKYRENGIGSYIWKAAGSNRKWLVGLSSGVTYEYEVRSACASDNSSWAGPQTFTTSASKSLADGNRENLRMDIYPNPADEFVYVNYHTASDNTGYLRVYDILGRAVAQHQLDATEGTVKIATQSWPGGQYLIEINTDKETITKKLMIVD
jgi:hypothetical protein